MINDKMNIKIKPVGFVDNSILDYLKQVISERFYLKATLGSPIQIEELSMNKDRGQYLSTSILEALSRLKYSSRDVSLGVAGVDLYVPSLNFVFGEASYLGRVAVISVARLKPSFYGLEEDEELLMKRAGKEAIHELGHVFKLGHCNNPRCVMFFSNSLSDTDRKEDKFCSKCIENLEVN